MVVVDLALPSTTSTPAGDAFRVGDAFSDGVLLLELHDDGVEGCDDSVVDLVGFVWDDIRFPGDEETLLVCLAVASCFFPNKFM